MDRLLFFGISVAALEQLFHFFYTRLPQIMADIFVFSSFIPLTRMYKQPSPNASHKSGYS